MSIHLAIWRKFNYPDILATVRGLLGTAGTGALIQLLSLLTGVILARGLDVDQRGEYGQYIVWITALSQLSLLGLHQYVGRLVGKSALVKSDALGIARKLSTFIGVPIGFLLFATFSASNLFAKSEISELALLVACMSVPFNNLNVYQYTISLCSGNIRNFNLGRAIFYVVQFLGALLAYILCQSIAAFIYAFALSAILSPIINRFFFDGGTLVLDKNETEKSDAGVGLRSIFRRNVAWLSLAHCITSIGNRADVLVGSLLLSKETFGIFLVTLSASGVANILGSTVGSHLISRGARLQEGQEISWFIKKSSKLTLMIPLVLVPGWFLLQPAISIVYGSEYVLDNSTVVLVLMVSCSSMIISISEELLKSLLQANLVVFARLARIFTLAVLVVPLIIHDELQLQSLLIASLISSSAHYVTLMTLVRLAKRKERQGRV